MVARMHLFTDNRPVCLRDNGADAFSLTGREGPRNLASAFQRHREIARNQLLDRAIGAIGQ